MIRADRLEQLAGLLDGLEWGRGDGDFCMSTTVHHCGSPSCIAGWAVSEFADAEIVGSYYSHMEVARDALGLSDEQADALFCPSEFGETVAWLHAEPGHTGYISPQRAAGALRRLAATGEVSWAEA